MYYITILVKYDTWAQRGILSRSVERECSWAVQKKEIEKNIFKKNKNTDDKKKNEPLGKPGFNDTYASHNISYTTYGAD